MSKIILRYFVNRAPGSAICLDARYQSHRYVCYGINFLGERGTYLCSENAVSDPYRIVSLRVTEWSNRGYGDVIRFSRRGSLLSSSCAALCTSSLGCSSRASTRRARSDETTGWQAGYSKRATPTVDRRRLYRRVLLLFAARSASIIFAPCSLFPRPGLSAIDLCPSRRGLGVILRQKLGMAPDLTC